MMSYLREKEMEYLESHLAYYSQLWLIFVFSFFALFHLAGAYFSTGVKEELMLIPENTELPPKFVQNGKFFLPVKWNFRQWNNSRKTKFYTIQSLSGEKCQIRLLIK